LHLNSNSEVVDYGCPECGFDGPHPVVDADGDTVLVECGSCYVEFSIPPDNIKINSGVTGDEHVHRGPGGQLVHRHVIRYPAGRRDRLPPVQPTDEAHVRALHRDLSAVGQHHPDVDRRIWLCHTRTNDARSGGVTPGAWIPVLTGMTDEELKSRIAVLERELGVALAIRRDRMATAHAAQDTPTAIAAHWGVSPLAVLVQVRDNDLPAGRHHAGINFSPT
jgi:hypothetical protein